MGWLVLEDGKAFAGAEFGFWAEANQPCGGEVVFNTASSGYQEMITDLGYAGQILTFTHPQMGNYGWHIEENEAGKILLKGLIVRELSVGGGSLHADGSLEDLCRKHKLAGLKEVDTRALTRYLAENGPRCGVLVKNGRQGSGFGGSIPRRRSVRPGLGLQASGGRIPDPRFSRSWPCSIWGETRTFSAVCRRAGTLFMCFRRRHRRKRFWR